MKLEANTSPLEVWLGEQETGHRIGRLAWRDHTAWFEFDEVFLASGLDLSPFHLPPRPGVHRAPPTPFDGLHSLFNDSLPDGWGRLLIDRQLMSEGTTLGQITPLDRLSIAGSNTMGALTYRPSSQPQTDALPIDLDTIQHETAAILSGHLSHDLE